MRLSWLLAALMIASSASTAQSAMRLSAGKNAEDSLRRFVEQDARLKIRLEDAARREEAFIAEARESDLRDAVSEQSSDKMRLALESLPGMKAAPQPVCRTIVDCPVPEMALEVPDAQRLTDSVRRLVRPWMVLQQARGSSLVLSACEGPGDAALTVRLKDIAAEPLVLNVAPRLLGGFKVWFDRPFVLAALYGRERDTLLHPAR